MPRFIEVDDPDAVPVGVAATAARRIGATHVLVTSFDGVPEILTAADLEVDDLAPISQRAGTRLQPAAGPKLLFQRGELAVVYSGDQPLMIESDLPLAGRRIADVLEDNEFEVFAADIKLPGPPVEPPGDPTVVYTCPENHPVPQRQSNPNRECPFCHKRLEL